MGETNDVSKKMISSFIGQEPRLTLNEDGTMSMHLGQVVMTADYRLWSEPSAYLRQDGTLLVKWSSQSVTLSAIANSQDNSD